MSRESFIDPAAFLEPWELLLQEHRATFERELQRELSVGHGLVGARCRAVARRGDCDAVLFVINEERLAVVHLTWSREFGGVLPGFTEYASFESFAERDMIPEHEFYMSCEP
ncbi:MAG: hypothetical protein AAF411_07110 [Myxococcota bacterium]